MVFFPGFLSISIVLILNKIKIERIYAKDQPVYHELKESIPCIEFVSGMQENINEEGYFNIDRNNVLVWNDMMTACKVDDRVIKVFRIGSHHKNLSIFYLIQNLFNQGKETRNITLNSG